MTRVEYVAIEGAVREVLRESRNIAVNRGLRKELVRQRLHILIVDRWFLITS